MNDYEKAVNQMCRSCSTKEIYCKPKKCVRRNKLLDAASKAHKYDLEHSEQPKADVKLKP